MTNEEFEFYLSMEDKESKLYFENKVNRPNRAEIEAFFKFKPELQQQVMQTPPKFRVASINNPNEI